MTVIVNTLWGGRISQIVDRQISLQWPSGIFTVTDTASNKAVIALTKNALVSITYTGVASAHKQWIDFHIANCLAHENLDSSIIRPGSTFLNRPIHVVMHELCINLNGCLNSDNRSRIQDLKVSIAGWHLAQFHRPFVWELQRVAPEGNGFRYFKLITSSNRVGKYIRENPRGLWGETLGNSGETIDRKLKGLAHTDGMTHDDVEFYFRDAIRERATETPTVSPDCIAIQLDPNGIDWHVQVTYYPSGESPKVSPFLSPWVLTPSLICAPTASSSNHGKLSDCGRYALGGFEDGITNLKIQTRIPVEYAQVDRSIHLAPQPRERAP